MTFYAHSTFCPPLEGVNKGGSDYLLMPLVREMICAKVGKALRSAVSRKQRRASEGGNSICHMVSIWYPYGIRMAWLQYNIPILHPYQCRS